MEFDVVGGAIGGVLGCRAGAGGRLASTGFSPDQRPEMCIRDSIHFDAGTFLSLFALALIFTWLYEKTGCLLAPDVYKRQAPATRRGICESKSNSGLA